MPQDKIKKHNKMKTTEKMKQDEQDIRRKTV